MILHIYRILCLLSLLMCISTFIYFARSFSSNEGGCIGKAGGRFWLFESSTGRGSLSIYWNWPTDQPLMVSHDSLEPHYIIVNWSPDWKSQWASVSIEGGSKHLIGAEDQRSPALGLAKKSHYYFGDLTPYRQITFPLLYFAALFAILPSILCISVGRRRLIYRTRMKQGLCLKCGYDLRASPERCPECGTPIPTDVKRMPIQ